MPDQLVPVRHRVSFAKLEEVLDLPDLVAIQKESFDQLLNEGIKEVLDEVSPIEDFTEQFQLYFGKHEFRAQKFSEEECRDKDITFSRPLFVEATFVNKVTGEIKEQEVFMGDFPMMTEPRHLHHQRHRACRGLAAGALPGRLLQPRSPTRRPTRTSTSPRSSRAAGRGSSSTSTRRTPSACASTASAASTSRPSSRRWAGSNEEILKLTNNAPSILATLEKDHAETQAEALEDIYRKLRPGEPPTAESAKTLLENLFFNPKRYDLAKVGRHKLDKKLGAAGGRAGRSSCKRPLQDGRRAGQPRQEGVGAVQGPRHVGAEQGRAGRRPHKYKGTLTFEDLLKTVLYVVEPARRRPRAMTPTTSTTSATAASAASAS